MGLTYDDLCKLVNDAYRENPDTESNDFVSPHTSGNQRDVDVRKEPDGWV